MSHERPLTDSQKRIMGLVEGFSKTKGICPLCGYNRFNGSIHPHAGNRSKLSQTKWCTGKVTIPAKEEKTFPIVCEKCGVKRFYTSIDLEAYYEVNECHECVRKRGDK